MLAVLLIAPGVSPLLAGGGAAHPEPLDISTELRGGWLWSTDQRVTNDPAPDFYPTLTIDANNTGDLLWQRNSTGEEVLHYARLAREGNVSHGPVALSNRSWRTAFDGQMPMGAAAAVDSNDAIHLTYGEGENIRYEKLDENGSTIVAAKTVGPVDGALSRDPSLVVGPDDTVHIVHGDYKFQCEDAVYDRLDNNGSNIWNIRVVSSDLASKVSRSLIRAEPFVPRFFFVMGSDTGTWYGRFDRFGVKTLPSVLIRSQTDYKLADVAGSVDGSAHLVWQDLGQLYYTRVNATGVKVIDAMPLPANGTALGVPRIAVSTATDIHIVWIDNRTGTNQVFWLQFYGGQNLTNLTPVQLSTSPTGVADPWVTAGPDGAVHVAWSDSRDGNWEIYHKFEVRCALRLEGDPAFFGPLSNVRMLPNQTRVLPLTLRNLGLVPEDVVLTAGTILAPLAANWTFLLNQSGAPALAPGASLDLSLSVSAPPDAPLFDMAIVAINATARAGQCLGFTFTQPRVMYNRSFSLVPDVMNRSAMPGEATSFSLSLTNTGDLPESNIQIGARMDAAHPAWTLAGLPVAQTLAPNETAAFNLTITLPANYSQALAGDVAQAEVWAASSAAPAVNVSVALGVSVGTLLGLVLTPDWPAPVVDPGQAALVRISFKPTGNVPGTVRANLSFEHVSGSSWNTSLSRSFIDLPFNGTRTADLIVPVPADAWAGESSTVKVRAVNQTRGISGEVDVTVTADLVCALSGWTEPAAMGFPGQTLQLVSTLSNAGNAVETLTLSNSSLPPGWSVRFLDGASPTAFVALLPRENRSLILEVTPAPDAVAGSYPLGLWALSDQCGGAYSSTEIGVYSVRGGSLSVAAGEKSLLPGGEAVFQLTLSSTTNGPSQWTLNTSGLPAEIPAATFRVVRINGTSVTAPEGNTVDLPAFGDAVIEVHIQVPLETNRSLMALNVSATFPQGAVRGVDLLVRIQRPDVAVTGVDFGAEPFRAGVIPVNMTLKNLGLSPSGRIQLQLVVDGRSIYNETFDAMAAGANVTVAFQWTTGDGHFEVRVALVRLSGPTDADSSNNELVRYVLVLPAESGEPPKQEPPARFLPGLGTLAVFAAGGLAAVAAVAGRRRHR